MNYILSVFKNLYRKHVESKIRFWKTRAYLSKRFNLSKDEISAIQAGFELIFASRSFVIGGAQSVLKDDAFALYTIVRTLRPQLMVETGTYQGYSSHVIIEALKQNNGGKFITCDIIDCRVFKGDFDQSQFQFLLGPSSSTFLNIPFHSVDIFFHDSDHQYPNVMFETGQAVKNNVKIILCHDFGKHNIHNTIKAIDGKGCREAFIEAIGDKYTWYEIPTINGIGLAIRK